MYLFGKSKVRMDKIGRVLIPAELRKGLGSEMLIIRIDDKLILRQRKRGSFAKCFDSLKLTEDDLKNMDDLIAEGGMMGNYK
ncbi:MAG: hypothetical protein ABIG96_06255 [Candidatus Micrarchaeota archaeon]